MRSLISVTMVAAIAMAATMTTEKEATAYERWLVIHNETSYDLCFVYISHVDKRRWGPDILGDSCLKPGYYRTVDPGWQQGYCMMDMRFAFEDDRETEEYRFNICEETDYYLYDPD